MSTATKKKTKREPQTKEVSVRRREKFSHIPAEVLQNADTKVGSVLEGRTPLRGLQGEEEKELLSQHLGIDADHQDFNKEAKAFWAEMDLTVPSEGTELNVSVDENGDPVELLDYIIYRWLQRHPYVAGSEEEMLQNPLKEFYIHDPERATKEENRKVKARKEAYKEFLKATEDEERMDMLLRVLGDSRPEHMTIEQKENKLEEMAKNAPKRFADVARDKNLEIRNEIEQMVEHEVLRKSGNSYFYMDELIGENIHEAIGFFQNKKNSSAIGDMRAKLKELK